VKHHIFKYAPVACLLAFSTAPAWGDAIILSTTGDIQTGTLTGSLLPGAQENQSDDVISLEQSSLSLQSGLAVDATASGVYNTVAGLTPGLIAAGTVISDTYFHSDPVLSSGTLFTGSITFSQNILGVISETSTLDATDSVLGAPGVVYAENDRARGLELAPSEDQFTISADLRTLSFSVMTWGNIDDLRVITAGVEGATATTQMAPSATPEPDTMAILGIGLVAVSLLRKRQRRIPAAASTTEPRL